MMVVLCLMVGCSGEAVSRPSTPARPDPRLTPGEVFAGTSVEQVCAEGYARRMRNVLPEQYIEVYSAYHVEFPQPPGAYELDHLIPLELGGDNSNRNLWPQPAIPLPGFNQKDQLENLLHARVCAGLMPLAEAQRGIATDWPGMYAASLRA
jgi:hypothetical protein